MSFKVNEKLCYQPQWTQIPSCPSNDHNFMEIVQRCWCLHSGECFCTARRMKKLETLWIMKNFFQKKITIYERLKWETTRKTVTMLGDFKFKWPEHSQGSLERNFDGKNVISSWNWPGKCIKIKIIFSFVLERKVSFF